MGANNNNKMEAEEDDCWHTKEKLFQDQDRQREEGRRGPVLQRAARPDPQLRAVEGQQRHERRKGEGPGGFQRQVGQGGQGQQ